MIKQRIRPVGKSVLAGVVCTLLILSVLFSGLLTAEASAAPSSVIEAGPLALDLAGAGFHIQTGDGGFSSA